MDLNIWSLLNVFILIASIIGLSIEILVGPFLHLLNLTYFPWDKHHVSNTLFCTIIFLIAAALAILTPARWWTILVGVPAIFQSFYSFGVVLMAFRTVYDHLRGRPVMDWKKKRDL